MFKNFSAKIKYKGLKSCLDEHNNNVDAVIEEAKQEGYFSPNSKLAYLKRELIRVKNLEVKNTDYYKENMYLLQEIREKINLS